MSKPFEFVMQPPPASPHAASRFLRPPLDGSLTVPEIYDWHYVNNPSHPLFIHTDSYGRVSKCSYSDAIPAVHCAARYVANVTGINCQSMGTSSKHVVVILADCDHITYFTTLLGVLRLGGPVMPISPRFTAAVVAHLLQEVGASHVLVTENMVDLANLAINEHWKNHSSGTPELCAMPTYDRLYMTATAADRELLPPRKYDYLAPGIIVHSSGSLSYPKPIKWNAKRALQNAVGPLFGAHDLGGVIFGFHSIELYHGIGVCFTDWVCSTGLVMATFTPATRPTKASPDCVLEGIKASNATIAYASPAMIHSWAQDPQKVAALAQLKVLAYGGSPLNKSVGDMLVRSGVKLQTAYGMTEAGGNVCQIFSATPGEDWDYCELNPSSSKVLLPRGDGTYELIFVSGPTQELPVCNTNYDGRDAYAAGDVLLPHNQKPGWWKVLGRSVDQIMLSTGETTDPGPLEAILCNHGKVKSAVLFGRNRPKLGFLVELHKDDNFDPQDENKVEEYRDVLVPQLDEVNAFATKHAQVTRDMLIFTTSAKPFAFNAKGLPRRVMVLSQYQEEIDSLYMLRGYRGPDRIS